MARLVGITLAVPVAAAMPSWARAVIRALVPSSRAGLRQNCWERRCRSTPPQMLPAAKTLVNRPRAWGLGPSNSSAIRGARPGWKKPTRQARAVKRSTWRRAGPQSRQAVATLAAWPRWLRCSRSRCGAINQVRAAIGSR